VAYSEERAVVIGSFLGFVHIEPYTVVGVDDDTGFGRIHHIDIEVDTPVLGLAIDFDPGLVGDEQLAKEMNLVEPVDPPLQAGHGMGVWKKC
jgi:hypothetical protein